MRNLDLTALRAFHTVAETGSVTRAASLLNLTQSAVSMQLKRLEESLGLRLLDRGGRAMTPTAPGEQMLSYARRILALNDEAWTRLTARDYEGEITLGVPHDILYPAIPHVLRSFASGFPRMRINLLASHTAKLRRQFEAGEADVILTTEEHLREGGETLVTRPQVWIGAEGGHAWRSRPLPLAFEHECSFRAPALAALDAADIDWEIVVDSPSSRTVETSISADLAVHVVVQGMAPPYVEEITHGGVLPDLPTTMIDLYRASVATGPAVDALVDLLRSGYRAARPAMVPAHLPDGGDGTASLLNLS